MRLIILDTNTIEKLLKTKLHFAVLSAPKKEKIK